MRNAARGRIKRTNWWDLGDKALCPQCQVPCIKQRTSTNYESGVRMQYRKCPICNYRLKTIIRFDPSLN